MPRKDPASRREYDRLRNVDQDRLALTRSWKIATKARQQAMAQEDAEADAKARQIVTESRDREWREWWDKVAKEADLRQSWFDTHLPPPDRK